MHNHKDTVIHKMLGDECPCHDYRPGIEGEFPVGSPVLIRSLCHPFPVIAWGVVIGHPVDWCDPGGPETGPMEPEKMQLVKVRIDKADTGYYRRLIGTEPSIQPDALELAEEDQ